MEINCPICGKWFSLKNSKLHINKHHPNASDAELKMIRDARRSHKTFFEEKKVKNKNSTLKNINKSDGTTFSGGLPSLGKKR